MKLSLKSILAGGAIALTLLGGSLGYRYHQYREFREGYRCLATGWAGKCSQETGFGGNCLREKEGGDSSYECWRLSKKIVKFLEKDVSFPYGDEDYYSLVDEYAGKRLSLEEDLNRLGRLKIRKPEEIQKVISRWEEMENFLDKLKEKGLERTAFYEEARRGYKRALEETIHRIEKGYFRFNDHLDYRTGFYYGQECRKPDSRKLIELKEKEKNAEKLLKNKEFVEQAGRFLCLERSEKKARDKLENYLVEHCDEGDLLGEDRVIKIICGLRKEAIRKAKIQESKIFSKRNEP